MISYSEATTLWTIAGQDPNDRCRIFRFMSNIIREHMQRGGPMAELSEGVIARMEVEDWPTLELIDFDELTRTPPGDDTEIDFDELLTLEVTQ